MSLLIFQGPSELEKEYLTSQCWGSLFTDDNPNSSVTNNGLKYMNTLWGYIIRKYSDIAVPHLQYLAGKTYFLLYLEKMTICKYVE